MNLIIRFDINTVKACEDNIDSSVSEVSDGSEELSVHGNIAMDGHDAESGVIYKAITDTYFYFPEGTDEEDILANTVKWVKEKWWEELEDASVAVDMIFLASETEASTIKLYGIANYSGGVSVAGRHAVSACVEKCDEQVYKFIDYWELSDADNEIKSIENRFPEEYYEAAEQAYTYDFEFADTENQELQPCIVISGNTLAELIHSVYAEILAYFSTK